MKSTRLLCNLAECSERRGKSLSGKPGVTKTFKTGATFHSLPQSQHNAGVQKGWRVLFPGEFSYRRVPPTPCTIVGYWSCCFGARQCDLSAFITVPPSPFWDRPLYVAQAAFNLSIFLPQPPLAGVMGVYYHTWQQSFFCWKCSRQGCYWYILSLHKYLRIIYMKRVDIKIYKNLKQHSSKKIA